MIEPGESLGAFHMKSRWQTTIGCLAKLRDYGRASAEQWIAQPDRHIVNPNGMA